MNLKKSGDSYTSVFYILFLTILFPPVTYSQESDSIKQKSPKITYTDKGFQLSSNDLNYLLQIEWRGQFRIAYPTDQDPVSLDDFSKEQIHLKINRARMKVGGNSFRPWLKYYLEYELFTSNLLDFRIMVEKWPFLKLKIGQWKVQYNRERIISSGKQQSMERSILTRPFTVDRQQGLSVYGRIEGNGMLDFNYWISVFMGTGRGSNENDDNQLMWMSRLQWNVFGRPVPFSGSDLNYSVKPKLILAIAGLTNRSQFTRFSQSGGGQLPGFPEQDEPGQYRINQWVFETAGLYKGLSFQQEFHWKQIFDRINQNMTTLSGNLVQAGYFPFYLWKKIPEKLEIYARYAFYDPFLENKQTDLYSEFSCGLNYFIRTHRNKLTAEISFLNFESEDLAFYEGIRYRLQWDISL